MVFLCVTNKELAEKLINDGNKVFRCQKDIEGNDTWFFESSHMTFDISDAMQAGDAFFSTTTSVVF